MYVKNLCSCVSGLVFPVPVAFFSFPLTSHWSLRLCLNLKVQLRWSLSLLFAEALDEAENELPLPSALCVPGCVCGARHPPGSALLSPHHTSVHHYLGRRVDQGLCPCSLCLQLPGKPAMDAKLRGAAEPSSSLFPLTSVHHSCLGTRAVCRGGTLGLALLGKGGYLCLTLCYMFCVYTHCVFPLTCYAWLFYKETGSGLKSKTRNSEVDNKSTNLLNVLTLSPPFVTVVWNTE